MVNVLLFNFLFFVFVCFCWGFILVCGGGGDEEMKGEDNLLVLARYGYDDEFKELLQNSPKTSFINGVGVIYDETVAARLIDSYRPSIHPTVSLFEVFNQGPKNNALSNQSVISQIIKSAGAGEDNWIYVKLDENPNNQRMEVSFNCCELNEAVLSNGVSVNGIKLGVKAQSESYKPIYFWINDTNSGTVLFIYAC